MGTTVWPRSLGAPVPRSGRLSARRDGRGGVQPGTASARSWAIPARAGAVHGSSSERKRAECSPASVGEYEVFDSAVTPAVWTAACGVNLDQGIEVREQSVSVRRGHGFTGHRDIVPCGASQRDRPLIGLRNRRDSGVSEMGADR